MELGISLQPVLPDGDGSRVIRVATEVERLGFDAVLMSGHVLADPGASALDPLVVLAAVAGATERVRLATSILVLPYYEPVVLANQAASIDVLSGGRFTLAVGAGWNEAEFAAVGVPVKERGARTDEHLQVLRELWSVRPTSFAGRFTSFRDATLGATPVTPGGPPIWVGGDTDAALRRALRHAEAWHGAAPSPEALVEIRERIARLAEVVGRDPATLALTGVYFVTPPGLEVTRPMMGDPLGGPRPTGASIVDALGHLADAGISMCNLYLPVAPADMLEAVGWIARNVLSELSRPRHHRTPGSLRSSTRP